MAQLPSWWDDVDRIFRSQGVPTRVWATIAFAESGFVEWKSNLIGKDNSWGLFQLNRNGGQGAGYASPYLSNPQNNATIAVKYIAPAVRTCGPDNIMCILLHSGHPTERGTTQGLDDTQLKWLAYTQGLFNQSAHLTGQEIFDTFTSHHGVPTAPIQTPDLPFDPTNPGSIATDIGSSIWSGFSEGFKGFFTKFFSAWSDEMITLYGPPSMAIAGGGFLLFGLILAAMKSPAVQDTVKVAGVVGAPFTGGSSLRATTAIPPSQPRPVRTIRPANPGQGRTRPG